MANKTVSLVLGSGGARGLAHIGVIQWLEDNGYDIRSISGCSMGALIGGVYACGKLDVYEEWVRAISKLDIVRLLDVSWGKQGLVEGERIITALKDLVGDRRIEDLPIEYTAVAADIKREKEVWLKRGSLFDAIRASISLPLFFTPFEIANDSPVDGVHAKIRTFIEDLKNRTPLDDAGSWKMLSIADQTFDAMQGAIARQKLAAYPPDHTIMIARDACGTLEFDRADEMITLGYETAARSLGKS
jgi:NTE family protein